MQPTPDFEPGKLAKSLLRRSRQGALATLMVGSGDPYCSLVNLASHPDGSPILWVENSFREDQYEYVAEVHWPPPSSPREPRKRSPGPHVASRPE